MRGSRIPETRRARVLRQSLTYAETVLWRALRGRSLGGFKFVRQEPIGPYFADFVCRDEMLVVEIDGANIRPTKNFVATRVGPSFSARKATGRPLRKRGRLSEY